MSQPAPGNPFADVLQQALALSKQVQSGQEAEPEQTEHVARRAEGLIRVTAGAGGEVAIELDPRVTRMNAQYLATEIAGAVNESLASLREHQAGAQNLDLSAINQQVEQLQQQATAQLNNFMDGILRAHDAAGAAEPREKE